MSKWLKLNPKIAYQAIAVLVLVIGDVVNQITQFYPHATWLPLVTTLSVLVIGYLKSAESKSTEDISSQVDVPLTPVENQAKIVPAPAPVAVEAPVVSNG